jgi:hypothetical protein
MLRENVRQFMLTRHVPIMPPFGFEVKAKSGKACWP